MPDQNMIRLLNRAITYFEENLTQPTLVGDVAQLVGYSRHHFSRLFQVTTGISPADYLRKRRLSAAADDLAFSSRRILDIALDYQFQSHEAFSRSFKQEFGVSPYIYRSNRRLRRSLGRITLGTSRLLYPGKGIDAKPHFLLPTFPTFAMPIRSETVSPQSLSILYCMNPSSEQPIKIRLANRQDIPTLCRLYYLFHEFTAKGVADRLQSLGDFEHFDAAQIANSLENLLNTVAMAIWVAEVNQQVVGLAEVYLREDEPNSATHSYRYGYLQSLMVAPGWRKQGIGQQLLNAAEQWSKEQGASELRLETWEFEQAPLLFYSKQGYRTLRRTMVRQL